MGLLFRSRPQVGFVSFKDLEEIYPKSFLTQTQPFDVLLLSRTLYVNFPFIVKMSSVTREMTVAVYHFKFITTVVMFIQDLTEPLAILIITWQ